MVAGNTRIKNYTVAMKLFALLASLLIVPVTVFATDPNVRSLVQGNNRFAGELYQQLAVKEGNQFISPYSISTALGMTYLGARGETAGQMAATLHFAGEQSATAATFGKLQQQLNAIQDMENIELAVANALFPMQGVTLNSKFAETIKQSFGGKIQALDFAGDAQGSADTINSWVAAQTNEKIQQIIDANSLDPMMRLVLANAIYFKGPWATPFDTANTKAAEFTLPDTTRVSTKMMNRSGEILYAANEQLSLVDLPYADGRLTMTVLLPNEGVNLSTLEQQFSPALLGDLYSQLEERDVQLSLPKFRIETSYELSKTLTAMGMIAAFSPNKADFSGLLANDEQLFIGLVIHKAFVEVSEEGTEAAAATTVGMRTTSIREPKPPVIFNANRPFLFLIRDRQSDSILFLGRLEDPRAAG